MQSCAFASWMTPGTSQDAKENQTLHLHSDDRSVLQFSCAESGKILMLFYVYMLKEMINILPQSQQPYGGGEVGNYLE